MRVAIYDPECPLCRRFASILRHFVPVQELDVLPCGSAIQRKLAPSVPPETCGRAFVLVEEDGTILEGAAAARRAVTLGPGLERYRALAESAAGRIASEIAYAGAKLARKGCRNCPP